MFKYLESSSPADRPSALKSSTWFGLFGAWALWLRDISKVSSATFSEKSLVEVAVGHASRKATASGGTGLGIFPQINYMLLKLFSRGAGYLVRFGSY